jgi:hypothetical protein
LDYTILFVIICLNKREEGLEDELLAMLVVLLVSEVN